MKRKGKGFLIAIVVVLVFGLLFLITGEYAAFGGSLIWAGLFYALYRRKQKKLQKEVSAPRQAAVVEHISTEQSAAEPPKPITSKVALSAIPLPATISGETFGSWDSSIHLARGQLQRFGRAFYSNFQPGRTVKGTAEIVGSRGNVYHTSLNHCSCSDFEKRHLPCKHIYGLALSLGYSADSFYSCYISAACSEGVPRPAVGYSNGLLKYQVHGKNPDTGRKNKRYVYALNDNDAISAAYTCGLSDPIEVAGTIPSDFIPLEEYQKNALRDNDIAIPPTASWDDGLALLRRLDNGDVSIPCGLLLFSVKVHCPCSLLSGGDYLLGQLLHTISRRDQIALYAAAVLWSKDSKSLLDCTNDPVSEQCYAFSDFVYQDEQIYREILNSLTVEELKRPQRKSATYKAVLKFFASR